MDLTNSQELTFDFSGDALPNFWDEMAMQLVFKGKLGTEDNAVAVSPWVPIDGVYSDMPFLSLHPAYMQKLQTIPRLKNSD